MDTNKYIDLSVGLAQAALGVYLSWRAFLVSLTGLTESEQRKHRTVFALCCLAVIALAGVQTYRNFGVDRKLDKIEANTEKVQPAPIVNVQLPAAPVAPNHTIVAWDHPFAEPQPAPLLPFQTSKQPSLNIGYSNVGSFTMLSAKEQGKFVLLPYAEVAGALQKYKKEILKAPIHAGGVLVPHDPGHTYWSYYAPPLSDQDVADLYSGAKALCGMAIVTWTDAAGMYRTYFHQCVFHQVDGSFNWHGGPDHNREEKLE